MSKLYLKTIKFLCLKKSTFVFLFAQYRPGEMKNATWDIFFICYCSICIITCGTCSFMGILVFWHMNKMARPWLSCSFQYWSVNYISTRNVILDYGKLWCLFFCIYLFTECERRWQHPYLLPIPSLHSVLCSLLNHFREYLGCIRKG